MRGVIVPPSKLVVKVSPQRGGLLLKGGEIILGIPLDEWWKILWRLLGSALDWFQGTTNGGVRICRIAEIIIDKAEDYNFPLRESKDKSERSLENAEINYTHMSDNKIEDNTPILKELDSTMNKEPTLDELNEEEDRLEFTNNTTWTFTAEERARERDKVMLEESVLTGGSSSSSTTGRASEVSPTSVKARVAEIEEYRS